MKGKLVLESGEEFEGSLLNDKCTVGEVVFNTSMSGYQEIFTDPSYANQIVVMTYPLIGNYGVIENQSESLKPVIKGVILNELYDGPIHPKANMSLRDFLIKHNIPTLMNVDCRRLTKQIRDKGSTKAIIKNEYTFLELKDIFNSFSVKDSIKKTTIAENQVASISEKPHIAIIDYGCKKSIKEELERGNARVSILPNTIDFSELEKMDIDGVLLSNGPGDPMCAQGSFNLIRQIQETYPTFGICLGHQILALVNGAKTYKMKFGHRGANHSVIDLKNNRVYTSSQNHSYAVHNDSLKETKMIKRFVNINDKSVEGLEHESLPVFSVQFHPEANSGPEDTNYLFKEFLASVKGNIHA
jgi:carbamoyl-phosphate synthase small subunit